ncbi:MAG TPA: M56 family metallopeptidase [Haliangiales bacterium]|nr:M56 family metallopeptidase [Haliangiales bacterium]
MIATIAAASAKATLLLGLALVAAWAWKRRPASARHLLWCLAIVGALAIPPLAAMLPAWRLSVLPRAETTTAPSWEDWLLALWLAGMLVVLGRLLLARIRIHLLGRRAARVTEWRHDRLRELAVARGVDRRVELLESAEVALPMTWGFVRPTIGLPLESRAWSRTRLDAALAHELAHVRRFDALTQVVAEVACAFYWFHPLAWLAARKMRVLRELACDDEVLANGIRPSQYAREMLAIVTALEEQAGVAAVTSGMARPSQLKTRLLAVLNPSLNRARLDRGQALALAGAMAALMLALAMIEPAAAAAAPEACDVPGQVRTTR